MAKNTFNPFAQVAGVNSAVVSSIVEFVQLGDKLSALKVVVVKGVKAALAECAGNGIKEAAAIKLLRAGIIAGGIDKRRVSEVLLSLGFRERAAAEKDAPDTSLDGVIAELVALATEKAGDKAISALRRAYLKVQATVNAAK